MLTGFYRSGIIIATAIIFYAADVCLMRRYDPQREYGSSRNWVYTALMIVLGAIVVAQPVVWPGLSLRVEAWWGLLLQVGGLVTIAGALALHWWARTHLGQFYAERSTDIQEDQHLINTGPYAYVRHPIYTSYFLLVTGLLLVDPALPMLIVTLYAFVDFSLAPRREEKLLVENVPGYKAYRKRTPAFLPRLGRREGDR
jgi:protein-S-isoprenylcysteine O-methyltransferase Ste14